MQKKKERLKTINKQIQKIMLRRAKERKNKKKK